jgi:hypothetical protein
MRLLLFFTLLISFLGCEQRQAQVNLPNSSNSEIPPALILVNTTDGKQFIAIIQEESKNASLSEGELAIVNSLLRQKVGEYNVDKDNNTAISLSKYKRPYFVSFDLKEEKIVEVNCFCQVHNDDSWKKHRIQVEDGGARYFNLKLNVTTRRILDYRVNGEG